MSILARLFPTRARSGSVSRLRAWARDALSVDARSEIEGLIAQVEALGALEIKAALGADTAQPLTYAQESGVAVIPISGVMLPERDALLDFIGANYAATNEVSRAVRAAEQDPDVQAILLAVDSPGGSVSGVEALSQAVGQSSKPTHAHGVGMMASAAYWASARADRVTLDPTALGGSIGVMTTVDDSSEAFSAEGVKRHLVSTGPLKGQGTAGVPVSDAYLAETQALVDATFEPFRAAVSEGRSLSGDALAAVTTGGAWAAEQAVALGLADETATLAEAFSGLLRGSNHSPDLGAQHPAPTGVTEGTMSNTDTPVASATEDLRAANQQLNAEIGQLKEQLAAREQNTASIEGKLEMLSARLDGVKADAMTAVLDKHTGIKFAAADRATWEGLAAKAYADDPKGLDAFLATMPDVLHTEAKGHDGKGVEAKASNKPDRFGLVAEDYARADNIVAFSNVTGQAEDKDGNLVALREESN